MSIDHSIPELMLDGHSTDSRCRSSKGTRVSNYLKLLNYKNANHMKQLRCLKHERSDPSPKKRSILVVLILGTKNKAASCLVLDETPFRVDDTYASPKMDLCSRCSLEVQRIFFTRKWKQTRKYEVSRVQTFFYVKMVWKAPLRNSVVGP